MSLKDDIALLATVPLFSGLTGEQLRLVAFGAERRRIAGGETLFREGAPADCAFAVASGALQLSRAGPKGNLTRLGTAGPGSLIGEMALITPGERKMTAIAEAPSDVIRVTRPLFARMLEEYPEIADLMHARIVSNLRRLVGDLATLRTRLAD